MGDMADFCNEQIEEYENHVADWRCGRMPAHEAYEMGIVDELGYGALPSTGQIKTVTCRCCQCSGLTWGKHQGKWRLFSGTAIHACPANPLKSTTTKTP
jgi:hypothetical protein